MYAVVAAGLRQAGLDAVSSEHHEFLVDAPPVLPIEPISNIRTGFRHTSNSQTVEAVARRIPIKVPDTFLRLNWPLERGYGICYTIGQSWFRVFGQFRQQRTTPRERFQGFPFESAMATVTIQEARANLEELIHRLSPGEEVVITENNQPVARLVAPQRAPRKNPKLGTQRGSVLSMDHFDDPLDDFREYMD